MNDKKQNRRQFFGQMAKVGGSLGVLGMIGGPLFPSLGCKSTKEIELSNDSLSVTIDPIQGSITNLHNKLTGEHQQVDSVEFGIVTDQGTISSDRMHVTSVKQRGSHLEVSLRDGGYEAKLHYELGEAWVEKWLTFTSKKALILKRIVMGKRRYQSPFREVHAHSDNTLFNVPINWFLRNEKGGWFTGVEFPFTSGEQTRNGLALAYGGWRTRYDAPSSSLASFSDIVGNHPLPSEMAEMNVKLQAAENFITEKEFLGVYRNTGLYREKELTGIPRILTTTPERLDWGEVWAMQAFMRHVLRPLPATHEGFELYMNGWWAGLPGEAISQKDIPIYKRAIDQSKQLGAGMFGYSPFWLGMVQFIQRSAQFVRTVGKDSQLRLSAEAQTVMNYVKDSKMGLMGSSEGLSHFREDRPDWKLVDKNGSKPGQLCWANTSGADWFFNLHNNTLARYKVLKFWIWDGGWLPGDPQVSMAWDCSAKNHSHAPGNIGYPAYQNVMSIFQRLREQYSNVGLGVCWAVKCGGPWALRHLDVHENFYENQGPDDLRFQMWYNQNSSFLPCEKNMSQVWFEFTPSKMKLSEKLRDYWKIWFTPGTRDYRYGLMSALSAGVDLGFMVQLPKFQSEVEKQTYLAFLMKWKNWASENLAYLKVKRDIFGQPLRKDGIDGNAHILNDRGFIFVFNPTETRHIGRVPLDDRIQLRSGKAFGAKLIYPESGEGLGSYQYGQQLLIDMPPGTCKLVEVAPHEGEWTAAVVPEGADIQNAF